MSFQLILKQDHSNIVSNEFTEKKTGAFVKLQPSRIGWFRRIWVSGVGNQTYYYGNLKSSPSTEGRN
jgi:hypothetical protein